MGAAVTAAQNVARHRQHVAPLVERLRTLPIFAELTQPSLERLARSVTVRTIAAGEEIVVEGETANEMFVIDDGDVEGYGFIHLGRR